VKSYLITDPRYYTDIESFKKYLENIYSSKKVDFACFRDKENRFFEKYAKIFVKISKSFSINKIIIHREIEIAKKLEADGVHLTSSQISQIPYAKSSGLFTVVSTHSLQEAKLAYELKADAITYSPVFYSPGKGEPKGEEKLREIVKKVNVKCFALGGITGEKEIEICKNCGCYGFASIRYFSK